MRINPSSSSSLLALALCLAGCSTTKEVVTAEHHGKITTVHHRRKVSGGTIDRIDSVDSKGIVTQAEIHVYDVGRLPTGDGGMHEAHRYYQVVTSPYISTGLPKKVTIGPRTVYTPPNYVPPPEDQRINDAVTDVEKVKQKLTDQITQETAMKGELQSNIDKVQALTDQLNMATRTTPREDKETPAANAAMSELQTWGAKQ